MWLRWDTSFTSTSLFFCCLCTSTGHSRRALYKDRNESRRRVRSTSTDRGGAHSTRPNQTDSPVKGLCQYKNIGGFVARCGEGAECPVCWICSKSSDTAHSPEEICRTSRQLPGRHRLDRPFSRAQRKDFVRVDNGSVSPTCAPQHEHRKEKGQRARYLEFIIQEGEVKADHMSLGGRPSPARIAVSLLPSCLSPCVLGAFSPLAPPDSGPVVIL